MVVAMMFSSFSSACALNSDSATYSNPIIHADYSDPDAIGVDGDFYMTASSFNCVPGLPVLHSTDLVHWSLISHALETMYDDDFSEPQLGKGVWAPSMRYHNGEYYIYWGDPDRGIFMVKARDPRGPWDPPHCVWKGVGRIDTCPFWDGDGQAYLVHALAKSRAGYASVIRVCRMSPDGKSLLDDGKLVFDGNGTQPTIEGPKFYKRDGWYYIFAPAGGVRNGWQTVLRSKNPMGPYEIKTVLEQGSTGINGPHQGAWVELENGEDWFLHFQDKDAYGRIVHLQPMSWGEDGWPLIGEDYDSNGVGEPVLTYRAPGVKQNTKEVLAASDSFDGDKLGLQW